MTATTRPPFLWVGGHPALDFLNTRPAARSGPVELLDSWESLLAWLVGAGLLGEGDATAARRLRGGRAAAEAARAFREDMRAAAEAIRAGRPPPPAAVAAVNGLLARPVLRREVVVRGTRAEIVRRFAAERADDVLVPVAEAAADLLCGANRRTLRRCGNPACVLWFTDPRGRRRWCSMAVCGNRMKVAAFHRRRLPRGSPPRRSSRGARSR